MTKDTEAMAPFAFHGETGKMVRLALVNLLWSIATLSIWRFWGRTRVRRLLWTSTTILGDGVEYTGTGRELFLGFLVVFVTLYLPIFGLFGWAQVLVQSHDPLGAEIAAILYPIVVFLISAGLYRARRYQLSRTCWRGIRGGQDGSALLFGLVSMAMMVAVPLTLGWALPWFEMWQARYKLRHTLFGDQRFDCDAKAGATYGAFAKFWIAGVVGVPLGLFLIFAIGLRQTDQAPLRMLFLFPLVYLGLLVLLTIWYAKYKAVFYRALAEETRFCETRFSVEIDQTALIRLFLGNVLISLFSLGILRPLTAFRTFRLTCQALRTRGEPDFAAIHQSDRTAPRMGEGLVSVFDGVGEF